MPYDIVSSQYNGIICSISKHYNYNIISQCSMYNNNGDEKKNGNHNIRMLPKNYLLIGSCALKYSY